MKWNSSCKRFSLWHGSEQTGRRSRSRWKFLINLLWWILNFVGEWWMSKRRKMSMTHGGWTSDFFKSSVNYKLKSFEKMTSQKCWKMLLLSLDGSQSADDKLALQTFSTHFSLGSDRDSMWNCEIKNSRTKLTEGWTVQVIPSSLWLSSLTQISVSRLKSIKSH